MASKSLVRIFSTPYGAETTSPYWYPKLGGKGWDYITAVVQHPYGESDETRIGDAANTGLQGWMGYIGPINSTAVTKTNTTAPAFSAASSVSSSAGLIAMCMMAAAIFM